MAQIKIFTNGNLDSVQETCNKFLETISPSNLIDVKFSTTHETFDILVIYKA